MRVLFNASTLVMGGALQVAVAFIRQVLVDDAGIEWHFAISRQVSNELSNSELACINTHATIFDISPAKSRLMRARLLKLQVSKRSDVVFTLFGPAYTDFSVPHVCGVADGWVTHSSILAFRNLESIYSAIRMLLVILYKAYWFRKANLWIVEALNAKNGLVKRLMINPELIHVVRNTCSQFYQSKPSTMRFPDKKEKIRILCLSAYYRSKNLEIIPDVIVQILELYPDLDFEFVITLPHDNAGLIQIMEKAKSLKIDRHINNIGPVRVSEGPDLYAHCHIAFLPSLLETFSANYPESMSMKRPIVTTDLDFARDACKDAALYFKPKDAKDAAAKLMLLINRHDIWEDLVDNGTHILQDLPTPQGRYLQCINLINSVYRQDS